MSEPATVDANVQTRTEQDGRVMTGLGEPSQALLEHIERRSEKADAPKTPETDASTGAAAGVDASTPVAPTRGQKRFAELTKEREDARAEAAALKAERETLARELSDLKARPTAPAQEPVSQPVQPAKQAEKFTYPTYADAVEKTPDHLSYDQWEIDRLDAYADWRDQRADLDARIEQRLSARESSRAMETAVERSRAAGRKAYADFDAVLASGPGANVALHATDDAQARARCAAIFAHPQSEHLQYAIMKDGDLARRLGGMDDIAFGFALATIAAPVAAPARAEHRPPPAPYAPVNGNSATVPTPSSELAGKGYDFDTSGYREKRRAERKRFGR